MSERLQGGWRSLFQEKSPEKKQQDINQRKNRAQFQGETALALAHIGDPFRAINSIDDFGVALTRELTRLGHSSIRVQSLQRIALNYLRPAYSTSVVTYKTQSGEMVAWIETDNQGKFHLKYCRDAEWLKTIPGRGEHGPSFSQTLP